MNVVHIVNAAVIVYSFVFFFMLICFAYSMHQQVMDNVTTNESIRKKWNAKNIDERTKEREISDCEKFRYVYFDPLPVSRI